MAFVGPALSSGRGSGNVPLSLAFVCHGSSQALVGIAFCKWCRVVANTENDVVRSMH